MLSLESWRAARSLDAALHLSHPAGGRIFAEGYASRRDYPQERFFGVGPDSQRGNMTDYLVLTNTVGGRAGVRPASPILVGGGLDYLKPYIGDGGSSTIPSISSAFNDTTAPGLSAQPTFIRPFAFVEVDYRQPKNARKGGLYRVDFSHYEDRDLNAFSFNRVDIDLEQAFSILAERRVFTVRAAMTTTDVNAVQQVPFYLMPTLGGNDTLRGFREYRFRGPHSLLLQGEYRFDDAYEANSNLSATAAGHGESRSGLRITGPTVLNFQLRRTP